MGKGISTCQKEEKKVEELMKLARNLGLICIDAMSLKSALGNAIGARMLKRMGDNSTTRTRC